MCYSSRLAAAAPMPLQLLQVKDERVLAFSAEHSLGFLQAQEFAKVMEPLFKQIAKCLNSFHFQVGHT